MRAKPTEAETARFARPADITALAALAGWSDSLTDALAGEPAGVWCQVVGTVGTSDTIAGFALYTTLFSTWQARDFIDIQAFQVFQAGFIHNSGAVLLAAVTAHAARLGVRSLRWQRTGRVDSVDRLFDSAPLAKLRFDLPVSAGPRG